MYVISYTFKHTLCTWDLHEHAVIFSKWKNICVKRVKADMCNDLGSNVPTFYVETTPLLLPYLFDFGLELVMIYYPKNVMCIIKWNHSN